MNELIEYPSPQIIQAPFHEERGRSDGGNALIGVHINDPALIGRTLMACGVDEADVPNWQIYTDTPEVKLGEKDVALDIMELSVKMDKLAQKRKALYSGMFKRLIAQEIMLAVAEKTSYTETEKRDYPETNKLLQEAAGRTAIYTVLFSIISGGIRQAFVPAALLGVGSTVMQNFPKKSDSVNPVANKISKDNTGLREGLTNTVLPVYFHDLSSAPKFVSKGEEVAV